MTSFSSVRLLVLLGMALACPCSRVTGLEAEDVLFFRTGPLSLKPQFSVSEVYNDNIFYLPSNEIADLVTTLSPGLKLQLGRLEHNYISLGYTFDELLYADNSTLDTSQHTIDIRDHLEAQRFSLTGSDRIQMLSSPLGGVERILTTRNIDRTSFDDNYTLAYDVSDKTVVYARAAHSTLDYQEGINLYDVQTLTGTGGFGYRAFPKTTFFGEVYYGQTTTSPNSPALPPNPDVSFVGGYVGARGNFTEKLTGTIKAGYEARQFSDGSNVPSEPVVDLSLTERFTDRTSLTLSYARQNNVSAQFTRETFTADIIGVQLIQLLGPSRKWEGTLGANYYRYAYDLNGRSLGTAYDYVRASFGLAYKIQLWLTASVGYDFERLTSNTTAGADYTVNRATIRLSVGF